MENVRKQQLEALEFGKDYIVKIVPAIKEILPELRGDEKEDTRDFLLQIVDGINFIVEIVNATLPLINEKEMVVNPDGIEKAIQGLSEAFKKGDNQLIAQELETGILPFLDIFYQISSVILTNESTS